MSRYNAPRKQPAPAPCTTTTYVGGVAVASTTEVREPIKFNNGYEAEVTHHTEMDRESYVDYCQVGGQTVAIRRNWMGEV